MYRTRLYFTRLPKATTGEINMTPLIDVLLVLLVMLILTVPVMTHSVQIDLPAKGGPDFPVMQRNALTIGGDDRLYWNGTSVSWAQLGAQLAALGERTDRAELSFEPAAGASYDRAARTIALIKDSGVERFGFVGNEVHRSFDRAR